MQPNNKGKYITLFIRMTRLHEVLSIDHHGKHSSALCELRRGRKLLAAIALYQLVLRLVAGSFQGCQGLLVVHGGVIVQQRGQQALKMLWSQII